MSREKPEWMKPCLYNEDRFVEPRLKPEGQEVIDATPNHISRFDTDGLDERDSRDVEEILRRPDRREERDYECTDTTPINYTKGPHDDEFGVDEKEFDTSDDAPVNYDNGAHEDELGVDDDEDELEPLDDEPEFDDED